jgi:hypothetical protein
MSMTARRWIVAGTAAAVLAGGAVLLSPANRLVAADHLDPPQRTDPARDSVPDIPADIADVYAWHAGEKTIIAMTFAGPTVNSAPAFYDRDVLYTMHIANGKNRETGLVQGTEIPTYTIHVRFGLDANAQGQSNFGVQFIGVPDGQGGTFDIEGPVETIIEQNGVKLYAGLVDDPFFFDSTGLRESRTIGRLVFDNNRNAFENQNDTAFVIEIPSSYIRNDPSLVHFWGETRRFGGNI